MTDTTATEAAVPAPTSTDAAETPAVGTDTPGEAESGAEGENDGGEPRGRAAQYRKRAQDAEAHSAELAVTVERLQQRLVERVVAEAGVKVAAVLAVSPLADLLDEDGLPDAGKIESAIDAARDQLGVRRHEHPIQRQLGMRSGASGHPQPRKDGWAAAFARRDD